MINSIITNPIERSIEEDANLIEGGAKFPSHDHFGKRSYNLGENRILLLAEQKVHEIQNAISTLLKELRVCEERRLILGKELNGNTEKYRNEENADQKKWEETNTQLEQIDEEVSRTTSQNVDETPMKKGNKKTYGLSFLIVAFLAECVAFLATFNLQKENLSSDAIWLRGIYVFVIYIYTIILYIKYIKTRIKAVKGLLAGCFLLGFVCLLHAIAVTFLNLDMPDTANTLFDLNTIEPMETGNNTNIISNLVTRPGLIEFLVATLLVFIGEIITIDSKKEKGTGSIDESAANIVDKSSSIDFSTIAKQFKNNHIEILKNEQKVLYERRNRRTTDFNKYVNSINTQLKTNEEEKEQAMTKLKNYEQELETTIDKVVSDLANYRILLMKELGFRLRVDISSFKYESATKDDVRSHYKLQPTNNIDTY